MSGVLQNGDRPVRSRHYRVHVQCSAQALSSGMHGERRKSFKNCQTLVRCRTAFKTQETADLVALSLKTKVSAEFRDKIHIWWLPCGTLLAWSKSGTVPDDPGRLAPMVYSPCCA